MIHATDAYWLWIVVLVIATSATAALVLKWLYRKRSGWAPGWGGVMLVSLCWIIVLALILQRSAS